MHVSPLASSMFTKKRSKCLSLKLIEYLDLGAFQSRTHCRIDWIGPSTSQLTPLLSTAVKLQSGVQDAPDKLLAVSSTTCLKA